MKHKLILIRFARKHPQETCNKFLQFFPPRLKTATTLPCETRKSYFSSLQQYDDVRNVTDLARLAQSWNTRQAMSQRLFDMTSLCKNWGTESILLLVNCFVYYTHLPLPRICHDLWWCVVDLFLHHSPNAIINLVEVQSVGWPHVRSSKFPSFTMKQLHS